jgi:hypothetical protein
MVQKVAETGSYRDPDGRVERYDGKIRRVLFATDDYNNLMRSGLYDSLVDKGLLVPHTEVDAGTIEPETVEFISYPYEWAFNSLKGAALATLDAALIALEHNMMLKDASAFNVQWHKGKWCIIDTLSFTTYKEGEPWMAYVQFLQQFLYPLLFRRHNVPYNRYDLEGITQRSAIHALPRRLMLNPKLAPNIYPTLNGSQGWRKPRVSKLQLEGFLTYLRHTIATLKHKPQKGWVEYDAFSYQDEDHHAKERTMTWLLTAVRGNAIDIGANTGEYTELARKCNLNTIAIDNDHDCANAVAPLSLWADICNPSPALGWRNSEREGLLERLQGFGGTVIALALLHHLCIGRNVPISMVLDVFASIGPDLIVEFVPPSDPMAEILGRGRVFPPYNKEIFTRELEKRYRVLDIIPIRDTGRMIYHAAKPEHKYP